MKTKVRLGISSGAVAALSWSAYGKVVGTGTVAAAGQIWMLQMLRALDAASRPL
ncbi:hypothetical protein HGQ17_06575 [Nesterenkonia sp. MY13]|uniref:Uncharacterized protein n=1 Tax=Nesterenkonia sedimenti TaxID=1463632 RepID=A0A7X8TJE2_9MICC|nr:hypothetical protein [Nesterenkonia sedimenti]NLS09674.1 hypothetical protein [Nesterenkonia sedimenti]